MILSYKPCINILFEPVKIDTKGTQTKNKTVRKYSNDKIQFTFFLFAMLPLGELLKKSISAVSFYIHLYRK